MVSHSSQHPRLPPPSGRFATTRWSIVVNAGGGRSPDAQRALATLCENYWFPLYAFVRRAGHSAEDAQDLTQDFFAALLAKNRLAGADRRWGRFRSYLLGAMKHFLAKHRRRQRTQKRGGHVRVIPLDFGGGEERYQSVEPADLMTPERLFEKRWALALLDLVFSRLREEFLAAGQLPLFDHLKPYLAGKAAESPYVQVAEELDMTAGAVKVAVHRLRRRYRKLLQEEIAQTVDSPEAMEDELQELLAALR